MIIINLFWLLQRSKYYQIALNYGLDIYFFPAIFHPCHLTRQLKHLLADDSHAIYNV